MKWVRARTCGTYRKLICRLNSEFSSRKISIPPPSRRVLVENLNVIRFISNVCHRHRPDSTGLEGCRHFHLGGIFHSTGTASFQVLRFYNYFTCIHAEARFPPGMAARAAMLSWMREKKNYDYASNRCSGMCAHYTQVRADMLITLLTKSVVKLWQISIYTQGRSERGVWGGVHTPWFSGPFGKKIGMIHIFFINIWFVKTSVFV